MTRIRVATMMAAVALGAAGAHAEVPRRGAAAAPPAAVPEPAEGKLRGDHAHARKPVEMSPEAQPAEFARELFGPDPSYADKPYDVEAQLAIYGGKYAVIGPRPPIEWGYPMYQPGPLGETIDLLGEKNPARLQLLAFGDLRLGVAYNDNGALDTAQMAARLNLNLDFRITSTERVHLFLRPFDRVEKGRNTRYEFGGNQRDRFGDAEGLFDLTPEAFFFEGDVGQIVNGLSDEYHGFDLPIAFGLMPLLFQNGIWMEDAILGGAITKPAMNSPLLDISNMDVTFFSGFDRVTTGALRERNNQFDDHAAQIFGTAVFIEAREFYIEAGYGYTDDKRADGLGDFSYHNATLAVTKRWFGKISNSMRVIGNFGQDPGPRLAKTADGWLVLIENSLITHLPSTLVPYANFFVGYNKPQSLARDFGAGGILKNTGINFETDGLTGFPKLDDTANDAYGGALGVSYLFNLDQQVVFEVAGLKPFGRDEKPGRIAKGDQLALGARYQRPLSKQWIFRTDAIYGLREHDDDLAGVRAELRLKF
ncbi:MAG TPA: hypothetical protein PJ986_10395 [Gammaproteobacteria bacterium]|nr:hypothetical protein [Gammaproteobacteria bacterium]